MKNDELIEAFIRPLPGVEPVETSRYWPSYCEAAGKLIFKALLDEEPLTRSVVAEASRRKSRPGSGQQARGPLKRRHLLGLTQLETARLLGLSERAVRAIEKRALQKLARHPELRQLWTEYGGELEEGFARLTDEEVRALFGLARTPEELRLMFKVISAIQ